MVGVWQTAQPMELNRALPWVIEVAPPGVVVDGVGGARRRMNCANAMTSLGMEAFTANGSALVEVGVKLVTSSGYPTVFRFRQLAGRPLPRMSSPGSGRSCGKVSLEIPISTL